jgi:RNA polymerase sigma-70 factor (sigma-E family)
MDTFRPIGSRPSYGEERPVLPTLPTDADRAVEQLYDLYQRQMVRVAVVLVRDTATAEDVVQDAFIAVHRAWDRIHDKDATLAYLHRSVINAARSHLRRRSVVVRLAIFRQEEHLSAEDTVMKDQLPGPLATAIAALPRREREAVLLRYYLDLPEKETAEALGLGLGSVKAYSSRGLAKLRIAMGTANGREGKE